MGKPVKGFGALVKRYAVVVIFPTIAITSIFADYRHTYLWKQKLAAAEKENKIQANA